MADNVGGSSLKQNVYAIIFNIPGEFRSSALRNYFSQLIEASMFVTFHYRHRPMKQNTFNFSNSNISDIESDNTIVDNNISNSAAGSDITCRTTSAPAGDRRTHSQTSKEIETDTKSEVSYTKPQDKASKARLDSQGGWANTNSNSTI